MQYLPHEQARTNQPVPAALPYSYQGTTSVPVTLTRRQKVYQFFLGLGLGLGAVPFLGVLAHGLGSLLGSRNLLLFPSIPGLVLLTGIFLTLSKSRRFLGLGILTACLIYLALLAVSFVLLFFFIQSAFQNCPNWPESCG
jgi:hypothetical protein